MWSVSRSDTGWKALFRAKAFSCVPCVQSWSPTIATAEITASVQENFWREYGFIAYSLPEICYRLCRYNLQHLELQVLNAATPPVLLSAISAASRLTFAGGGISLAVFFDRAPAHIVPAALTMLWNAVRFQTDRGPSRMIPAPTRQIAAPVISHGSGRCFSMIHSQASDDAM